MRNYAKKASTREAMWRAFTSRAAPQNIALLEKMLVKRQELARTLGYANWADYVTENKMIRTGKAASDFIERISAASGNRAARRSSSCSTGSGRTCRAQRHSFPGTSSTTASG